MLANCRVVYLSVRSYARMLPRLASTQSRRLMRSSTLTQSSVTIPSSDCATSRQGLIMAKNGRV